MDYKQIAIDELERNGMATFRDRYNQLIVETGGLKSRNRDLASEVERLEKVTDRLTLTFGVVIDILQQVLKETKS